MHCDVHVFAWLLRYAERAFRLPADSDPSLRLCRAASDVTDSRSDPSASTAGAPSTTPTSALDGVDERTGVTHSSVLRESASESAAAPSNATSQKPQYPSQAHSQAAQDDALVLDSANALSLLISSDFRKLAHISH